MATFRKYQHGCVRCFAELDDLRYQKCEDCRTYHREWMRDATGYYDCRRIYHYDRLLAWLRQPRTGRQLIELTGFSRDTVFPYLTRLRRRGLIVRTNTTIPATYQAITKESTWRPYSPSSWQLPNVTDN